MTDIRDLAWDASRPLRHWSSNSSHPGYHYCCCTTGHTALGDYRIHIAKKADFKVLGSFPSMETAQATMEQLYKLEAAA